jgi:hypothetical protein
MGPYSIARTALDLLRATSSRGRLTLHLRGGYASVPKNTKEAKVRSFSIRTTSAVGAPTRPFRVRHLEVKV